ncbi:MAG: hypothetical protein PSY14_06690 [bacterium]|nr:hypothetical protein [bacterium]
MADIRDERLSVADRERLVAISNGLFSNMRALQQLKEQGGKAPEFLRPAQGKN